MCQTLGPFWRAVLDISWGRFCIYYGPFWLIRAVLDLGLGRFGDGPFFLKEWMIVIKIWWLNCIILKITHKVAVFNSSFVVLGDRAFVTVGTLRWNNLLPDLRQPDLWYIPFWRRRRSFYFWPQCCVNCVSLCRLETRAYLLNTCCLLLLYMCPMTHCADCNFVGNGDKWRGFAIVGTQCISGYRIGKIHLHMFH